MEAATLTHEVQVPPRSQFNMRLDPRTAALLAALQRKLNLGVTGVIRLAIARLAEAEHIEVPDDAD
jgi:hypothetical protein